MKVVAIPTLGAGTAWRDAARGLLAAGVPPEDVLWQSGEGEPTLFGAATAVAPDRAITVPRSFVSLADTVVWHRDPERFARLYAFLWRLVAHPLLMSDNGDAALARLREMDKNVRRCKHKMTAFLRFREVPHDGPRRRFAAWFEPTHYTLEPTAPFFVRRFGDMDWAIATPDLSATFVDGTLAFGPGADRPDLPQDATEALWGTYFSNIFNPARVKLTAMTSEMPKKYWKNMPEGALIPGLVREAEARVTQMREAEPTTPPAFAAAVARARTPQETPMPDTDTLPGIAAALEACTRCPLHGPATQAVPGEGPAGAALMIVGEQPGDQEDLAGRPFVGPAGQLFDRALGQAGIDRGGVYLTNAVKHFKFTPRGKRRIHAKPSASEIKVCSGWLDLEIERVEPALILAMGATALQALTGSGARILARRGGVERGPGGRPVLISVHPSYLLRLPGEDAREEEFVRFVKDLRHAAALARQPHLAAPG